MNARAAIAMVLGYAIPGAGHLFLGRRARGIAFFLIVAFLFVFGLYIDGALYSIADARRTLLRGLATLGSMGAGALYFAANSVGAYGDVTSNTYEYGTTFTLTAGLMNLLLVLDCYDIAMGRKP